MVPEAINTKVEKLYFTKTKKIMCIRGLFFFKESEKKTYRRKYL